jgi:hypothetical protein
MGGRSGGGRSCDVRTHDGLAGLHDAPQLVPWRLVHIHLEQLCGARASPTSVVNDGSSGAAVTPRKGARMAREVAIRDMAHVYMCACVCLCGLAFLRERPRCLCTEAHADLNGRRIEREPFGHRRNVGPKHKVVVRVCIARMEGPAQSHTCTATQPHRGGEEEERGAGPGQRACMRAPFSNSLSLSHARGVDAAHEIFLKQPVGLGTVLGRRTLPQGIAGQRLNHPRNIMRTCVSAHACVRTCVWMIAGACVI